MRQLQRDRNYKKESNSGAEEYFNWIKNSRDGSTAHGDQEEERMDQWTGR